MVTAQHSRTSCLYLYQNCRTYVTLSCGNDRHISTRVPLASLAPSSSGCTLPERRPLGSQQLAPSQTVSLRKYVLCLIPRLNRYMILQHDHLATYYDNPPCMYHPPCTLYVVLSTSQQRHCVCHDDTIHEGAVTVGVHVRVRVCACMCVHVRACVCC
jgi:hypothetical protein